MSWKAYVGARISVLALGGMLLWGCGDDPEQSGQETDAGHHDHDAHAGHHDHDGGHHMHSDAGAEDLIASCRDDLPAFEPGLEQLGQDGHIRATLVGADPSALRKGTNDLVFDFTTPAGDPITDLTVKRAWTYMPIHDHDGTFMPEAMAGEEPGRWNFAGFNFSMRGPWQIRMEVESAEAGTDLVVVEVCVGR